MKANKNLLFVCQVTQAHLKVLKCRPGYNTNFELLGAEAEIIPLGAAPEDIDKSLVSIFKKLGFRQNPVIVSLPAYQATCRYVKIPSAVPAEIERIAGLQASHYLPYPAEELVAGYQIIETDKEGYSNINLIIAHKDAVERYLKILKTLQPASINIVLSSYGLCNLYNYCQPHQETAIIFADIDYPQVELALIQRQKLLFNRSFKLTPGPGGQWQDIFFEEINKTQAAYLNGPDRQKPSKIVVSRPQNNLSGVETLIYKEGVEFSGVSFASLIGLALMSVPVSLSLLPGQAKQDALFIAEKKSRLQLAWLIFGIIVIWLSAIGKSLSDKEREVRFLKARLSRIADEVNPLEELEKRFKLLDNQSVKKFSSLDILSELYRLMPQGVSLVNFIYDETQQMTLRGIASDLNSVFNFTSQLERSAALKKFNVKVRYATQRNTQSPEAGPGVDFEITCAKK